MPSFYGWCDLCLSFYPITTDEFEEQFVEFAKNAISVDRKKAQVGKQLCPECEKKVIARQESKPRCRRLIR